MSSIKNRYFGLPVIFFLTHMKNVCNDAGRLSICGKTFNVVLFLDTINMMNVKLCMMLVLIELYPVIPLSMTLIVFQGHRSVKQF